MTIQRSFFDWGSSGLDWSIDPWEDLSPNLLQLHYWLTGNYGGQPLGLADWNREIRGGGKPSDHAYGAAVDWRHGPNWLPGTNPVELSRSEALAIIAHIIDWSAEFRVQRIHDYVGDRIWTAGRTSNVDDAHGSWWRTQNGAGSGMGESWAQYFHIATTRDGYFDDTPIDARGIPLVGAPSTPPPQPVTTTEVPDMIIAAKQANHGPWYVSLDGGRTRRHVTGRKAKLYAVSGLIDAKLARVVHDWSYVGELTLAELDELLGPIAS